LTKRRIKMKFELFLKSSIVKQLESGLIKLTEEDMYSIWVKTFCCALNADQLRKVAGVSDKYGRGYILFTSRQIATIPFIRLEDTEKAKKELEDIHLKLDRCGSRVRNINVCWGEKICAKAILSPASLSGKLDTFFYDPLPHKIKMGVSACPDDCIAGRFLADIHFIARSENGNKGWDAYLGGKLGLNAFCGLRVSELLTEEQAVKLTQNFFELMRKEAKKAERSAELIRRLGLKKVRESLNKDLEQKVELNPTMDCASQLKDDVSDKLVLRIRTTAARVSSEQARKIAELSEKYGRGIIYFGVRGTPEIPGVAPEHLADFKRELGKVGMSIIENGIDNLYACWGSDCTHCLLDTRDLIQRIEMRLQEPDMAGVKVRISGASCSNSCGLAYLSDIGIMAGKDPEVDPNLCNGCKLCVQVCQRNAIEIKDKLAVIDRGKCKPCGQCLQVCPLSAIAERRAGFLVFLGGKGEGDEPRLGELVAQFLTEDEAFQVVEKALLMLKERQTTMTELIEDIGIKELKTRLLKDVDIKKVATEKYW